MPRVNPSSPVYSGLQPDAHAQAHLILVDRADAAFAGRATLLYAGEDLPSQLLSLRSTVFPDVASLPRESVERMERAVMGMGQGMPDDHIRPSN